MLTRSLARLAKRPSCVSQFRPLSISQSEELVLGSYSPILPEEPFVYGVSHIPIRSVPAHIIRPPYVHHGPNVPKWSNAREKIVSGTDEEQRLRQAAALAQRVREFVGQLVKVGVTTNEIDSQVHQFIVDNHAYPSPLLYKGFPKSCCTSVNNIIAHGIPDDRPLEDGDIINVDITVYLNGFHGDTSDTWTVGSVDATGQLLCEVTRAAVETGIRACGPGRPFRGIGKAIHDLLKRPYKGVEFCVSPLFNGHGIGSSFHREPWILHHLNDEPGIMEPGDCFTIEPCVIHGTEPTGWIFPDGWTASTENCARSAQKEHMVLITETGVDVLTS